MAAVAGRRWVMATERAVSPLMSTAAWDALPAAAGERAGGAAAGRAPRASPLPDCPISWAH